MKAELFFVLPFLLIQLLFAQLPIPGDINGNGVVDSLDIIRGKQIALEQHPPATQQELAVGDMNRDGRITVQDLVFIRNTIAEVNRPPVADAGASPDSGLAGTDIQLDATRSFDLDGDALTYHWRQLHMNRFSTEYLTESEAVLSDSISDTPIFNPEWPGNYRFELTVTDALGLVEKDTIDVVVGREDGRKLDFKGLTFGDFFGPAGGPEFDPTPENSDSQAAVQDRAMDAPVRSNVEWIGINPAFDYLRINPLPHFGTHPNDYFYLKETEYAAIVSAAKSHGLKTFHLEQSNITPGPPLRPGEIDSLEILMDTSSAWWEEWFNQLQTYILGRADWAEQYNVEMFVVYQNADFSFRPERYPQYGDRWRVLIDSVRAIYSGKIALHIGSPEKLDFADALDALFIQLDGNGYVCGETASLINDIRNPTIEEIRTITESILDDHESYISGQVPVYYYFQAASADAQPFFFPAPPMSELDYREQVIYYEAIIQAFDDETWVNGMATWFWEWFDALDHPGLIFDAFTGVSPRNKPAEDVIKLWFGIY